MLEQLKRLMQYETPFAITCEAEEDARELLAALAALGFRWNGDVPITDENGRVTQTFINRETGGIAYYFFRSFPLLYYGRKEFFKTIRCELLRFSDLKNGELLLSAEDYSEVTYIEIFDETAIENICSALAQMPSKIIFVGENRREMEAAGNTYRAILEKNGKSVTFEYFTCEKTLGAIVKAFSAIAEKEKQCCFDITGGDDIFLVALGIVFEKYKSKKLQIHLFDIGKKTITDCDGDGVMPFTEFPQLSVEEEINIYGGRMRSTSLGEEDKILGEELNALWDVMMKFDSKEWNDTMGTLNYAIAHYPAKNGDALLFRAPFRDKSKNFELLGRNRVIINLAGRGLLERTRKTATHFEFRVKNDFVRRCFAKSGNLLEMKIYCLARSALRGDGVTPVFNDVRMGVFMDWSTKKVSPRETVNEIDVMMMDGLIPVFVSCKNGSFSVDELYKLNAVAENFGGKYARKILVANRLTEPESESLCLRARNMGIKLIYNISNLSDERLTALLADYNSI